MQRMRLMLPLAPRMAKNKQEEEKEMSFLDHLEALRWHLVRSSAAILIGAILAFIFSDFIFDDVIFGPKKPDFITYRAFCKLSQWIGMGDDFCMTEMPFKIINNEMGGQFSMHMWVSIVVGIVFAFPYIVFEIWRFIKPALYSNERQHATGGIFYTSLLFLSGVSFGYFLIAPLSINFLANYTVSAEIDNFINISSYISTITMVTLASGVLFELPIFIYFLSKIGLVNPAFLRKYRRHAIVLNLIASAIITPPDVVSQIIVALPLAVLYEVGIVISGRVEKQRLAKDLAEKLPRKVDTQ
jgi:sec-independent protein translocase protein TatC